MIDYYEQVKAVLEQYPKARDDDMVLYAIICRRTTHVSLNDSFFYVLLHHKSCGLPSYESVTRIRRKVQENEPDLRGKHRARRKELEEEYRDRYRRQ